MDNNLSDMLKNVLGDPDAMEKLMGAAKGLMGNSTSPGPSPEPPREPPGTVSLVSGPAAGNAERIALIAALRPYLSPARQKTADQLMKMLKMLKLTDLTRLFSQS